MAPPELCPRCGSFSASVLQQRPPNIAAFAAAEFDPFGAMAEVSPFLMNKYGLEIKAIKAHG